MAYDYELLKVEVDGRRATVTVSNPPINLITLPLYMELVALSEELAADPDLTVVVMKSADPDFFLHLLSAPGSPRSGDEGRDAVVSSLPRLIPSSSAAMFLSSVPGGTTSLIVRTRDSSDTRLAI